MLAGPDGLLEVLDAVRSRLARGLEFGTGDASRHPVGEVLSDLGKCNTERVGRIPNEPTGRRRNVTAGEFDDEGHVVAERRLSRDPGLQVRKVPRALKDRGVGLLRFVKRLHASHQRGRSHGIAVGGLGLILVVPAQGRMGGETGKEHVSSIAKPREGGGDLVRIGSRFDDTVS